MSEYWVSKKKYFCKYCEIYIADDAPSRQQHENGLRHQGNRERFIRNIYKASEKKKKDSEEEKRELARVEQAAQAAFAQDVSAGRARPNLSIASTSASTSTPARRAAAKPSNPFANYTTAESLGYKDPDAERAEAEAEYRRTQGVVGQWQVVTPPPPPPPPQSTEEDEPGESITCVPMKREVDAHSDDDYDRHSKLRKKSVRAGLGEIYDPGIIPIKVKKKEDPPSSSAEGSKAGVDDDPSLSSEVVNNKPSGPQKWVKVQWNQLPGGTSVDEKQSSNVTKQQLQDETTSPASGEQPANTELKHMVVKAEEMLNVKSEEPPDTAPVGGSLFKKRRTPASVAANRGRREV